MSILKLSHRPEYSPRPVGSSVGHSRARRSGSVARGVRRLVAGAIAVIAAVSLTACSAGSQTAAPAATNSTLHIGLSAAPSGLDFTTTGGAAVFQALVGNVYEGLVRLDDQGQIQPLLATGWTISDDGLRYSFQLREGVTFHDGTPFDANVVKASLERVPQWTANTPKNLAAIDHVEVVSPTQADVVLKTPDSELLFWLSTVLGVMIAPDSVADLATHPNGTGPFRFSSYDPGTRMVMNRNDDYWGDKAQSAELDLYYYADASSAANALRSGQLNALYAAEAFDQIDQFKGDSAYTVSEGSTPTVTVLSMNQKRNPQLADVRVRRAITHAIDKDAVLAAATSGHGTVLNGPSAPGDAWYDADDQAAQEAGAYDPDQARQLLAEAGAEGLTLTFTVPNRPYALATAQVIQSDLQAVGVTVNLETQEFPAVWVQKTMGDQDFDLSVVAHVEAHNMFNFGNDQYYWSYSNAEVDQDLADAVATTDDQQKTDAMKAAQSKLIDDAAAVWLYNVPNVVIAKNTEGLPENYYGAGYEFAQVSFHK